MSTNFMTSSFSRFASEENCYYSSKGYLKFFQVEITNFDMETEYIEVEAHDESDAADKARYIYDGDIYMMNVYIA